MQKLGLRLYGPFSAIWADGQSLEISSSKQRALLALLATAPDGIRTRSWIQDMLWSLSGPDLGRASLRRALSNFRKIFRERFDYVFSVSNMDIRLRPNAVSIIGSPADGKFLEGIVVQEPGFLTWVNEKRENYTSAAESAPATIPRSSIQKLSPSIATIPFTTLPAKESDGMLGDMFAQEITRVLSRSQIVDVISHLSCRNVHSRSINLDELRQMLGVDYVIYGTIRTDNIQFKLDADFINTETGRVCWTRGFEGLLTDFFNGQDNVVNELGVRIGQTILSESIELAACNPLPDAATHALFMSGIALMHRQTLSSFSKARVQIEEVIRRVPKNSILHAWLAKWYILSIQQGWSTDLSKDSQQASERSRQALDLNPECAFSLVIDGFIQNNLMKQYDKSCHRFDEAIQIEPNNALAWLLKGTLLAFMDEGKTAVSCTNRARSLSPLDPHKYFFDSLSATACLADRDYETALRLAVRSLRANSRHTSTLRVKTIALQILGQHGEARQAAKQLLRLEPSLTVSGYLSNHPAAAFNTGQEWAKALGEAGIPIN
jgi:TolB-like protein